jgi:hypothetical protein
MRSLPHIRLERRVVVAPVWRAGEDLNAGEDLKESILLTE